MANSRNGLQLSLTYTLTKQTIISNNNYQKKKEKKNTRNYDNQNDNRVYVIEQYYDFSLNKHEYNY